jgi:hypothetical protein
VGISNEYLMHLGHLVVCFQELDLYVSTMVWQFIPDQRRGQIITAELSFRAKVQLMTALGRQYLKDASLFARLDEIGKRAVKVEESRNRIIHSNWITGKHSGHAYRLKHSNKRGALRIEGEYVPLEHISALVAEIIDVTEAFAAPSVELLQRPEH